MFSGKSQEIGQQYRQPFSWLSQKGGVGKGGLQLFEGEWRQQGAGVGPPASVTSVSPLAVEDDDMVLGVPQGLFRSVFNQ